MKTEQKIQIINEIKRIERELYLKKSQLASIEAMEYGAPLPRPLTEELNTQEWKNIFSELTEKIGLLSVGGNSVEDIRRERER